MTINEDNTLNKGLLAFIYEGKCSSFIKSGYYAGCTGLAPNRNF